MSDEAVFDRARRAKAVLENETVTEAIDHIAERLTAEWRHTPTSLSLHREILHAQVYALDSLKAQLAAWIDQARALEIKREREAQRRRPLRVVGR